MKTLHLSIMAIVFLLTFLSTNHASAQYSCPGISGGWHPKIATDNDNVYVVWNYFYGCGQRLLLLKHSSDNGETFGNSVIVADASQAGSDPTISASGNNVYAAWTDYSTNPQRLLFKMSANNGASFDSSIGISSNNTGENKAVGIIASGNNIGIIWNGYVIGGNGSKVFLSEILDNAKSVSTVGLSEVAGSSFASQVVEKNSKAYVLWTSYRNCDLNKHPCPATSYVTTIDLASNSVGPAVKLDGYAGRIAVSGNNVYVAGIVSREYNTYKTENGIKIYFQTAGNHTITFAKSADGGKTFGKPEDLGTFDDSTDSIDNLALDASGNSVYLSWVDGHKPWSSSIMMKASNDGGNSFGDTLTVVGSDAYLNGPEPFTLQQQVSASNNNYYAIWQQVPQELFFRKSTDHGQTLYNEIDLQYIMQASNPGFFLASSGNNIYIAGPGYGNHIVFSKSSDNGSTFANATDLDRHSDIMSLEYRLPSSSSMKINSSPVKMETFANGTYDEAVNFTGNVGQIQKHMPLVIRTFKNDEPYRQDIIVPLNITADGNFMFDSNVVGNSTSDSFKIFFLYGDRISETDLPFPALQQQLDTEHTKTEQRLQQEQQSDDAKNSIVLAEIGIPIACGILFAIFIFHRKK